MSHKARLWCVYQGGSFWRCLCCLTVFTGCLGPTAVLGCSNCTETLTGLLGQFSSPCFPKDYLPNLNCRWTILAPPGFIVQLTFHDFELEEAQGCPYDFVSIETGAEKIKFCGVTAKGHTLNSTRNEMIVEFKTDFSIQKNGFSATYRRVAVSLRNQKVVVDKSSQRQAVSVSPSVSIPDLEQFTVCLEAKSSTVKKNWVLFSYLDSNNLTLIDFRNTGHAILLEISNVECDVSDIWKDDSSGEVFTGAWRQLCITWDGASGDIITQTQTRHHLNHCPDSKGKGITGKGFLTLAPKQQDASKSFSGQLYNFRLWNFTMPGQSLVDLPCEEVGSVVDWENSFWDIPVSTLEADSALSCATALPTPPTVRPTCSSLGSGCQATSPANSNTLTTNMHTTNSVDPSTNGTNAPLTEVTTHGSRETTDLTGSFNEPDLQRFQVLPNDFWQGSTSHMEQRSGRFRNPLGIISTPLRFPLRPRPSTLKPMFPNVHSASIVFTKTVTKNSRVTKDSKDLEVAANNIAAKKHLPPSFFPNIAGGNNMTDQDANISELTSEFLIRLKKPGRHFWDLKLADKNSTGNVTGDSFEMTPLSFDSHESLAELGSDAGLETLSLKPSISSILSPNHRSSGQRSSDGLNILEIQPQTPFLVLHQPINPTPTGFLHEVSMGSIVSHEHLLHGSLWTLTNDMNQLGNPLNLLGDQFITETSASLQGNIECSIDSHGPKFCTDHSNTKSSSTASPQDNSPLTSWPSSLLDPGQVDSIISSLPFERDNNSFNDTQLRPVIELLHIANTGKDSMPSTQRLLISTEQITNQLRQSQGVTLHSRQFSARSQIDGTSSLENDVDKGSSTTSAGLHIKMDHPDGLEFVSTTPIMSDMLNISPIPDNFLDVSLRSSNSEFSAGLTQLQANAGKLSLGSPESSVHFSSSPTVQSANASTVELQPGSGTSVPRSRVSVATRVLESLLENASPVEDSQWRSSGREARTSLLPVSKTFTDKGYSQVPLTGVTLHNTRSQLPAPVVTENKWAITTIKATGSLTKNTWVSQVALYTSFILPSGAPYLENGSLTSDGPHPEDGSLTTNTPHPGNESLTTNTPHPGNGSLTTNTPHPGNGSLTTNTPHPGNESSTTNTPHPGNGSLTTNTPHPGNESLITNTPHPGNESLTTNTPHPGNESLTTNTPHPGNGSLTTNTPHPGNGSLTTNTPHPGNGSLTTNTPHPGNGSLTTNTPHPGNGSLTTDIAHPGNRSLISGTPRLGNKSLSSDILYLGNGSLTTDMPHPGNESLTTDTPHSETDTLTFATLQRKNDSNGLHRRNDSSAVESSLKSSLEVSVANIWSSQTVPLNQRPEVTVLFKSLDVDQNIRSENTTLLHPERLSKLDQIPTLTLNSSHGYTNGIDFPSFSLTVPGPFQENLGVFQSNHSGVIAGSYSQEDFVISATRREMEAQTELQMTWLALSLDRADSLLEEDSRSPASLEGSKGQQVMTLLPVDLGAPLPSLSTHTPLLSKDPQLVRSSGIFTRTEPELTLASRSVQSSNDTLILNSASTIQKHVRTLDHHTSEFYVRETHTYNLGLQSFPLGEEISGMFSATSMGAQMSAGSQEAILVPTLPMDFPVVPSMSKLAWEIGMSTETNKQLLKGSQTSTHLPRFQSSSSSAIVTSPPVLPLDVPGFGVTFNSGLDSREPSVTFDQASLHCLCEAIVDKSCLCGMLIANRGVFYRTQFMLYSQSSGSTDIGELEQKVSAWLTRSFQNWNYTVYVETVRIFESNTTSTHRISSRSIKDKRSVLSYICKAILYYNITKNIYLEERVVQERLINTSKAIGNNLSIASINVQPIVNCSLDENPAQYKWTDTRPRVTLLLPCLTNPGQYASRKCLLNTQNYTSYWEPPDLTNCSIGPSSNTSDFPLVSADNAANVANQLLDFTADKNLTREQVDKLVETLNQIVIVSEINSSLASTVLTVLSNILSSSDNALTTSSQVALRTVDTLTAKMIFSGPSVSITTPNLAIGISAIDSQTYNGTSFSVGSQDGESELEVSLDRKPRKDTLAEIELSPGVFERLTEEEISEVSRTQFAFFSRTGLFQDPRGFSLQSFVVASSVGNITISNLSEPVRIRIKHRNPEEKFKPLCAFWDLTLNNGSGGWSTHGCYADPRSSVSETICLCNHLTHFGVLLDISGTAQQIDAVNTKILTFITHIGCGISAIFSATTLLTYVAFEKLRRDYPSKILMNLSTSLFFLNFTFLIDGWLASFNIAGLCIAVAALLHFFLLASFTWMGLEAVHMYIALVKVFNTYIRKYMLKFCIIGWGLPALVVVIVLAIDRRFYGMSLYGKDATDSGASEFCWINNRVVFYVTCVCYFAVLFLMNISMFIVVLIQICGRNGRKSNRNLREEILRNLRSVTSLTFLLGMTWGFAFFAWGPVNLSFMYLFAIFNSLQGFFIFVFHCALKENVQKQWRRYLCCGRFRLPENSDWSRTITNNTKKVSSENLGKSLSSSSIGSNSTSWSSKFKSGSSLFKSSTKGGLLAAVTSSKFGHLDAHQEPVVPVPNVLDKVTSYYPTHSDNFYKNIMMSENFSHSTKF